MRVACVVLTWIAWAIVAASLMAADSAAFRGPAGNGISPEKKAPLSWSPEKNVKWKAPLPQPGNSSPIISAGRMFITCAEDPDGMKRSLYCLDRKNGKQLWVQTADFGRKMPTHGTNPYCASTPAADGRRVVAWHGTAGVFCYDLDGKELWRRDLGEISHEWGYASSPVILGEKVILSCGPGKRTFMTALDLESGKTLWETPEDLTVATVKHKEPYVGTWATPVIAKVDGQTQIIVNMPTRVVAYDPADGKVIWWCEGLGGQGGELAYSSTMINSELGLGMAIGGYGGPGLGFKLGGKGDVTESNRLWRTASNPQSIGTGVFIGKYVYRPNASRPAAVECLDAGTGKVVWSALKEGGACWGSVIAVGDRLYVTNQSGTTFVFRANPEKFELLAQNELGEGSNSTPAMSAGQIFIRTMKNVYCIEE
jgi:outer membrane protein assembly factor BamB